MVNGGRGAGWRIRCVYLVFLLHFLLFAIGNATPSSQEDGDPMALTVDDSTTPASKLRNFLNSYPALREFEVHSTRKGAIFPEAAWGSHSRTGLWSMLRKFIGQFFSATILNSCPIEGLSDQANGQIVYRVGSRAQEIEGAAGSSSSSGCRKLLLKGSGYPQRRSSSSPRYFWAVDKQIIRNEGRRVLEETVSSPAFPDTQQVLLGPPAPPDLVHNEKQDWNQDYAEPDVHPPSSN